MNNVKLSYNGLIDEAARFVEKIQLLDRSLWENVIGVFEYGGFENGWHGEFWGKLMRGGCMVYKYSESEELYNTLTDAVKGILSCQDDEGRISAYDKEYELLDWDVWCRKYVMYGLMYYMEICRDEKFKTEILIALTKHADYIIERIGKEEGKKNITETSTFWLGCNSSSILRPYVMLYKLTNEQKYLDFAEYIISEGGIKGGNLIEIALLDKLAPYQYPEVKAYETTSFFEGVFEYATLMGNERLIEACIKYGNKFLETDVTVIGGTGCYDELFDNSTKKQVTYTKSHMQETCVTVTLMEYLSRLFEYTGDTKYADAIELSFYNAFLGAINREYGKNDGLHFDSYSPILNNRRGLKVGGKQTFSDGSYYGCCAAIGPAGFGAVTSGSAAFEDGTLRLTFYENGKLLFGENEVTVETAYPFDGTINVRLARCDKPIKVACRIPSWCKAYSHSSCGSLENGYFITDTALRSGDTFTLKLEMPFVIRGSADFDPDVKDLFSVSRGPIVFATEEHCDRVFFEGSVGGHSFDGIESSAIIKSTDGTEAHLHNYASVGVDWTAEMTVWLKKQ
jgi:DUF1680 family protein